ncbi:MAG: alpha/beta hydrolase [Pseudomonadota bacterium]
MTWTTRQRSEFQGLAAVEAGSGPAVMLIHGVGLRSEAWLRQIDALSARYHILAVDLPGHGGSRGLSPDPDLEDFTDAFAALLSEPSLVVGHSMGAMIALDMARRYPQWVRGVAALNAIFEREPKAAQAVQARALELDGVSAIDPSKTLSRWFGDAETPERDACRLWLETVDPAGYRIAYRIFAARNGPKASDLATLRQPALFLTGGAEPNSTPAMSDKMAALAPKGRSIIVPDAAHMLPMSHAEAANAALKDFAAEVFS